MVSSGCGRVLRKGQIICLRHISCRSQGYYSKEKDYYFLLPGGEGEGRNCQTANAVERIVDRPSPIHVPLHVDMPPCPVCLSSISAEVKKPPRSPNPPFRFSVDSAEARRASLGSWLVMHPPHSTRRLLDEPPLAMFELATCRQL